MRTIGIIGAMEEEIEYLKNKADIISAKNIIGLDFYMGTMNGNSVVLVRSGIGKVNAALCTQILIDMYAVDCIINVGVAGAVEKDLEIGDIVISSDAVEHDFDTSPLGDPVGFISRMNITYFKADRELIETAMETAARILPNAKIKEGTIASGDQFIADSSKRNYIKTSFGADCAEMEGAAVAHACYLNKLPFVIIRSISDKADDSSNSDYPSFFKKSAETASIIVFEMTKKIKENY